jgi:hypothetical protein
VGTRPADKGTKTKAKKEKQQVHFGGRLTADGEKAGSDWMAGMARRVQKSCTTHDRQVGPPASPINQTKDMPVYKKMGNFLKYYDEMSTMFTHYESKEKNEENERPICAFITEDPIKPRPSEYKFNRDKVRDKRYYVYSRTIADGKQIVRSLRG